MKRRIVYTAFDDKQFETAEECSKYEKEKYILIFKKIQQLKQKTLPKYFKIYKEALIAYRYSCTHKVTDSVRATNLQNYVSAKDSYNLFVSLYKSYRKKLLNLQSEGIRVNVI